MKFSALFISPYSSFNSAGTMQYNYRYPSPGDKNVMLETHGMIIANQTGVKPQQVEAVRSLLDAGATIPFIARYRKEKTGSLDEVVLSEIRDSLARLRTLDTRRRAILTSLEEQN